MKIYILNEDSTGKIVLFSEQNEVLYRTESIQNLKDAIHLANNLLEVGPEFVTTVPQGQKIENLFSGLTPEQKKQIIN